MRDLDAEAMKNATFAVFAKANEDNLQPDKIRTLWPSQHHPYWNGLAEVAIRAYLAAIGAGGQAVACRWRTDEGQEPNEWLYGPDKPSDNAIGRQWKGWQCEPLFAISQPHPADERVVEALRPFAWIGQWLFARDLPDDTPMVTIEGAGKPFNLTRGMFKAAHTALSAKEGR